MSDTRLIAVLDDIEEFLEGQQDVVDGSYGEQEPNRAMSLLSQLAEARTEWARATLNKQNGPNDSADAKRYNYLLDFPDGARHMLHLLLAEGKGDKVAFNKLVDRCIASLEEIKRRSATGEKP